MIPRSRRCAISSLRSSVYPSHWSTLNARPSLGSPSSSASGPSRWAGRAPKATGEIITEVPTSFHVASDPARPAFSQSSCARPVIVRSGSSTEPLPMDGLLGAEGPQVQQVQIGQPAEAQPPVDGALGGGADRHPLEVRLLGGRHPRRPHALRARGVVLAPRPTRRRWRTRGRPRSR